MSPSRFRRVHVRTVALISICIAFVTVALVWATAQRVGASAGNLRLGHSSAGASVKEGGIAPEVVTITVNSLSDVANASDGLCTLREAITAANNNAASGAAVGECAAGTSSGSDAIDMTGLTGTINLTGALPSLNTNMTISGPGSSQLTVRRDTGGDYRIFTDAGADVSISGMTVTNGRTPDGAVTGIHGSPSDGGSILNDCCGTLTLTEMVVTGNRTGDGPAGGGSAGGDGAGGGGVANVGTLTMTNSSVTGNTAGVGGTGSTGGAGGDGGGVLTFGALTMTNCSVTGNQAGTGGSGSQGGRGGYGGGISTGFVAGDNTLTKVTVSNNFAGTAGAGGPPPNASVPVYGGGSGGGIAIRFGGVTTTTISNSTINGNQSGAVIGWGGGIFATGSTVIISGTTVNNNVGITGGGIYANGTPQIFNTTISGNSGSGGAGIGKAEFSFITNCTITGNTGSAAVVAESAGGSGAVRNTIIAANDSTKGDVEGSFTSQGHNLIGDRTTSGGTGFTNGVNSDQVGSSGSPINPQLAPLANNGGLTMTHALLPASPALDAGDSCVGVSTHCGDASTPFLQTDQRGAAFGRSADGPDVDTLAVVDIGAYEMQTALTSLADPNTNEDTQLLVAFDGGDTSTITSVTATSSNSVLVPNDSAHLSVAMTGSTGIVTINPAANENGTTNITVTINRTGGPESKTFALTVTAVNDVPSFVKGANQAAFDNAGAQTVTNWATGISAGPADESGQTLTFQVTGNTNAALFSAAPAISSTGTLTYTPALNASGSATITINLKDNGGTANGGVDTSASQTFTITVTRACSSAPVVINSNDSGIGSLRDALAYACNNANVTFDMSPGHVTSPISLLDPELQINSNMTIQGPGAALLTIKGSGNSRVFNVLGGTVAISGLTITNGVSNSVGGAGILNAGTLTLTNVNLYSNTAPSMAFGGGIKNTGSLTLNNCAVGSTTSGGNFASSGGGIHQSGGTLLMNGGSISKNTQTGIFVTGGTATLTGVVISNNDTAQQSGAGILITGGTTNIRDCLITANTSQQNGGGIAATGGSVNLVNTTISQNLANIAGGGLYNAGGSMDLTNVTITENRAVSFAGGLRNVTIEAVILRNTILAGNFLGAQPSTTPDNMVGRPSTSSSFNIIGPGDFGDLVNGVNNNQLGVTDARLGPLADNGGPAQTYALLAGSPALDAGSNTLATNAGLTNDQRGAGFPRFVDSADADATATVDIGAFEAQFGVEDIADKSMNEDSQLQFTFIAAGAISSATASSSNTTLVPNNSANLAVSGSGAAPILTINPVANLNGTSTITVTVNDGSGQSMSDTFVLTVNAVNDAPSFTKGADQTVFEDAGAQTVTNWATALSRGPADESGQTLTFQIINNSNAALFSAGPAVSSNGTLTYTPALNANGSATITINLKDGGGTANGGVDTSASTTFVINVNPVNDAPSFTKGANQTGNEDAGAQTVNSWATAISPGPANEAAQTVSFNITGNTNAALFSAGPLVNSAGNLTYTPAANANGSATITINIQDNGGTANGGMDTSASQTFTIQVNAVNDTPSFTKGADQTVNNNAGAQTVTNWATNISAGPSNESGQTVTFQITGNTNQGLFTAGPAVSSSGTLTYTPSTSAGGTATITLVAKDNGGTTNGGVDTSASQTFTVTVTPLGGFVNFASSTGNTTENSGATMVNVVRTGDSSKAITVNYASNADPGIPCSTANGVASPKCDFTAALGTLNFAVGETSKPITILISQDSFVEGPENITLTLSSPTSGSALGTQSTMSVAIADDASEPPTNIIDDPNTFVRMHYHDFLNREGDQSGLDFWTGQMTNCGNSDLTVCRVNVSGAFFLSIEFQQTGYLVERMYKVGYGDATGTSQIGGSHQIFVPVVRANEFLADTQRVGRGVVVNQTGWETVLENNKEAYALEFVQTSRFTSAFPTSMTPAQFVDKLNTNAGGVLSVNERTTAINLFGNSVNTTNVSARAQALRLVAEDTDLYNAEFNRAFVLTEYIGYLRRNPNDPPESTLDYTGYDFWLGKLNQFNGNYVAAEMVKAFIASDEYRKRFGP